jgi:hypothetical protein
MRREIKFHQLSSGRHPEHSPLLFDALRRNVEGEPVVIEVTAATDQLLPAPSDW